VFQIGSSSATVFYLTSWCTSTHHLNPLQCALIPDKKVGNIKSNADFPVGGRSDYATFSIGSFG
jgi:hypothetical protein